MRQPIRKGLLTRLQVTILKEIQHLSDVGRFYLAGGTALAEYYLGHRLSFVLDLFTTEQGLVVPFSRLAEGHLPKRDLGVAVMRRLESFVDLEVAQEENTVRVQFAYDSPYRFAPPVETSLGKVNDFQDLIVDKLLAFFGRAEPRDAVDLAFIFEEVDPWELIELAPAKDPGFDLYWFALALRKVEGFPNDVERWPVEMKKPLSPPKLKGDFQTLADEIMARLDPRG